MKSKEASNGSSLPGFMAQMSFRDSYNTYGDDSFKLLETLAPAQIEDVEPDGECRCIKWTLKRVCARWEPFDCNV
jgi:hypothetical protein